MSITGTQLVQDALAGCGAYGPVDTLADADAQLVLRRLNRLLESWANENLMVYEIAVDTLTMVAGTATYLSSSLASAIRPVSVDSAYLTLNSISYPLSLIDNQTWGDIPYKPARGLPQVLFADPGQSTWSLNFYPTPDAAYVLNLSVRRLLAASAVTLATTISLPPGYERAIVDNLSVDIAPSFGRQVDPVLMKSANDAKANLKRANYIPLVMESGIWNGVEPSLGFIYNGF